MPDFPAPDREKRIGVSHRANQSTRPWIAASIGALVVFGACLGLFDRMMSISPDMWSHAQTVQQIRSGELAPPANFLYYLTLYLGSGLQPTELRLFWSTVVVLSLAVAARYVVSFAFLRNAPGVDAEIDPLPAVLLALAVSVAFSLPTLAALDGRWYLGQTPPNVWHNSTLIFLMPLAIGLFWVSYRNLLAPSGRNDCWIALLGVLNVLAKPSFFMVFALVYPLMLLSRSGGSYRSWARLWPVAVGLLGVAVQYVLLFQLGQGSRYAGSSSVALRPFDAWSYHSSNIPLSILASTLFPVAYVASHRRDAWREPLLRYALLLYGVALAIMALLTETGPRRLHGNFFWQAYACNYLLFLATATLLARRLAAPGPRSRRDLVVGGLLGLHVASGIGYLVKVFLAGNIR